MLKSLVLCLILLLSARFAIKAQTTETSLQYKVQYTFGERTVLYKMTYLTDVTRTYSSGSTKTFNRTIEMYLSFWRSSGMEEDFAKVRTAFDSINYEYNAEDEHYKWSSIHDDDFPTHSDYLNIVFPIVGRTYTTTLSPYFEVAKIEGPALVETNNMIRKIKDTVQKKIWEKANSFDNLTFYSDMNKNVIKSGRYAIDSTWKSKFSIPIEGIRYTCDTTATVFYLYDGKNFNIKAEMQKMYPNLNNKSCIIGAGDTMFAVDSSSTSKGSWDISVSPRGMLDKAVGAFETQANYYNDEQQFKDLIKTEIKYELIKIK